MQTFVPYDRYDKSAEVLDLQRLGKQIIEGGQIMRALYDPTYGWQSHPATLMWHGHAASLHAYLQAMHSEWWSRRHKPHAAYTNLLTWLDDGGHMPHEPTGRPAWLGCADVHESHRANLYRKDPIVYARFSKYDPSTPYVWPVTKENGMKWTRVQPGFHRSEAGHLLAKRGPELWELTSPDDTVHSFTNVVDAKAFVSPESNEDTQENTPMENTTDDKPRVRGAAKGLDARLARMADAAEAAGLAQFADTVRAKIGSTPTADWVSVFDGAVQGDGKPAKVARKFATRFTDPDSPHFLGRLYSDIHSMENAA